MPEQVTITIPDGYERITTVEDMPKCTHLLLANEALFAIEHKEDCGIKYISATDDQGDCYSPMYEAACKEMICLKKQEPKRVERFATVLSSAIESVNVTDVALDSDQFPVGTKVKVTVEEVIE